ncbi:MAG: hypothetical protein KatS3mg038_1040 [Candidatus Kapaibacterium sp.]|nr:MAG: hypothetical protein KatS3mg038_1040 [Candidatus Kapabacteria bacterium]
MTTTTKRAHPVEVEWEGVIYRVSEMTYEDAHKVLVELRALPEDEFKNDATAYWHIQAAFLIRSPIAVVKAEADATPLRLPFSAEAIASAPVSLVSAFGAAAIKANQATFAMVWDFLLSVRRMQPASERASAS